MKKWCSLYGEVICFDLTYNLLRLKTKKKWGIGLFCGFDSNLRIILFGIAIMSK